MLISIQGLILIEQPYFNEPAYEIERLTDEGALHSRQVGVGQSVARARARAHCSSTQYNEQLRIYTARHAMLDMLRQVAGRRPSVIAAPTDAHQNDDSRRPPLPT